MPTHRYDPGKQPAWRSMGGLTLVEILVAMGISLALTVGTVQLFIANKQTYNLSESLGRIQEGGRYTLDVLKRDIQMGGFSGCGGSPRVNNGGSEIPEIIPVSSDTGNNFPLVVQHAGGETFALLRDPNLPGPDSGDITAGQTTPIKIGRNVTRNRDAVEDDFFRGQQIFVGDCAYVNIVTIGTATSITGGVALPIQSGTIGQDILAENPDTGEAHGWVRGYSENRYRVQETGRVGSLGNAINALYRTTTGATEKELVQGVDALHTHFGVIVDSGSQDDVTDDKVRYVSVVNATSSNVTSIRDAEVAVLISSNREFEDIDPGASYSLLGTTVAPSDKRTRKATSAFINIRNR